MNQEIEQHAVGGWQYLAAKWLEQQAEKQEETNVKYPQHAAAYKEWSDLPLTLRMLAEKVKKAEGSIKRHCPPPSWMFPGESGVVPTPVTLEDAESFLGQYHAEVWAAAESEEAAVAYDDAGRSLAKAFLERFGEPKSTCDADTLCEQLQKKCSDWGAYWRAPDAHGVILTTEQAHELLCDALGVEVEIKPPALEPEAVGLSGSAVSALIKRWKVARYYSDVDAEEVAREHASELEAALAQDRASQGSGSWDTLEWLRLKLMAEPVRREKIGGQTHSYLDAGDVIGWVEEAQTRAGIGLTLR